MSSKSNDKTFRIIVISAALIALISVAVCLSMLFLPDRTQSAFNNNQNNEDYISYVSPSDDVFCSPGQELTLSVCARNGADVYAMISGQKIPLSISSYGTDGYNIYSGVVILPAASDYIQNLGSAAFFVTYE